MSLIPLSLSTSRAGTPQADQRRALLDKIARYKHEIEELNDPFRAVAALDMKSRALQAHVAERKEHERDVLRRQQRVMERFARENRRAFAVHFRARRAADQRELAIDAAKHHGRLMREAAERDERRFVEQQLSTVVLHDLKEATADVKRQRAALYRSEMREWQGTVAQQRRAQEQERSAAVSSSVAAADSAYGAMRADRERQAAQAQLAREETAERDDVVREEMEGLRRLLASSRHAVDHAQRRMNATQQARYRQALDQQRATERAFEELASTEQARRGRIITIEMEDRRGITHEFRRQYGALVDMTRRYFHEAYEARMAEQRSIQTSQQRERQESNATKRAQRQAERLAEAEARQAAAAEAALADRARRLEVVRDSAKAKVEVIHSRRVRTLMLLRGERAPSETAPYRVAAAGTVSHVKETLPPALRDEVVRMIRDN